jgi:ATP-dependent DNA helicase RecQ
MNSALFLLKKIWNYQVFRDPQGEIINAVIRKQDVLALLPTGAGKSICFQIPALINDGLCIVISPLIALMEDQINSLNKKGIKGVALTSRLNREETINAFDNLQFGNFKFLYLSPEKLQLEFIQEKISQLNVNLIAVDEAHCISEWGHDFRPSYLKISILRKLHPEANVIALTASATPKVMEDMVHNLELENVTIFKKSFYRQNLNIKFFKTENVFEQLNQILSKINEPVIVYTNTRKSCIHISNYLNQNGFKSMFYHGGLPIDVKSESLKNWMNQSIPIIVATNAFGMGIDKANVRAVIHLNIPNSIENYIQEIGRAGRDGKKSFAYLIYNNNTIFERENYLRKSIADSKYCKNVYIKLNRFYQISPGEINKIPYSFNLQDFCSKYNLPIVKTFSALNNLEHENIIDLNQNTIKKSRLKIIVGNNYLFEYERRNPNLGKLLKLVLRNYGGIFEQFIPINEKLLANKLNSSRTEIIRLFQKLSTDKIIDYNQAFNDVEIKFLVPREDNFVFNTISKNIRLRNKIKINKSKAIIDYIVNDKICRNIQLLQYFGENKTSNCNNCDICSINRTKNIKISYDKIAEEIILLFANKQQIDSSEIFNQLSFDKKYIIKTLQLLVEKKALTLNLQNKFEKINNE